MPLTGTDYERARLYARLLLRLGVLFCCGFYGVDLVRVGVGAFCEHVLGGVRTPFGMPSSGIPWPSVWNSLTAHLWLLLLGGMFYAADWLCLRWLVPSIACRGRAARGVGMTCRG